jgi:hypothetical protein
MPQDRRQPAPPLASDAQRRAREALATNSGGMIAPEEPDNLPEAPISDHFTLQFVEQLAPAQLRQMEHEVPGSEAVKITIRVAGRLAGELVVTEHQWARIWRAIVHATGSFERQGIAPLRTGRFR